MRIEKIGKATLYLGDCTELLHEVGGFDSVVTDPPYGMDFHSNFRQIKHDKIENDDTGNALKFACELGATHSKYIFCRWNNLVDVPGPRSVVTWVKNNWSMGDLEHEHARQTEMILFYAGPNHSFPSQRPTDVVTTARTNNSLHPTEKPLQLMRAVVKWTKGIVLDPFMGSGTTGVACAEIHRPFVGVEINEKYFDIACKRIEEVSKQSSLFLDQETIKAEQAEFFGDESA